jgi:MFS family permease
VLLRRSRPEWLSHNVAVLSAVSFAQDAASELLYPVLPLFLTVTLGAPAAVVGFVEGAAEGAASLTKYVSGRWSDRIGRKPLIGAGYGTAAAGKVVVAAAWAWPVVLVGRVLDRLGKGTRGAPRDALLAEGVASHDLGRVFGFHRAMDTAGAVVGPLLGIVVLALTNDNLRVALWIAVIPAVLSALLVGLVHEGPRPTPAPRRPADAAAAEHRHRSPLPMPVLMLVGVLALVALVNLPDALLLLRVSELGFGAAGVSAVYVLYNLVYALLSYPAGALSERWPRHRVYALGLACFAVGVGGMGLVSGGWAVVVLMLVYGGFAACTDGVGKAWITAVVPAPLRGRAQGVFQAVTGLSVLVAGIWGGLAWGLGTGDGVVPLVVAGTLAGVCAVALAFGGGRLARACEAVPVS